MVNEDFKNAVDGKNIVAIRNTLCNKLLLDHNVTGGMFSEYINYCRLHGLDTCLYAPHDGRELRNENSEEYYNTLVGQLNMNFSKERLERAVSIAKNVWKEKQSFSEVQSNQNETEIDRTSEGDCIVGKEKIIEEICLVSENGKEESNFGNEKTDTDKKEKYTVDGKTSGSYLVTFLIALILLLVGGVVLYLLFIFLNGEN